MRDQPSTACSGWMKPPDCGEGLIRGLMPSAVDERIDCILAMASVDRRSLGTLIVGSRYYGNRLPRRQVDKDSRQHELCTTLKRFVCPTTPYMNRRHRHQPAGAGTGTTTFKANFSSTLDRLERNVTAREPLQHPCRFIQINAPVRCRGMVE